MNSTPASRAKTEDAPLTKTPRDRGAFFRARRLRVTTSRRDACVSGCSGTTALRTAGTTATTGRLQVVEDEARVAVFTVDEGKRTAECYGAEFHLFPDQAHNLMAEPRSREIADTIATWLTHDVRLG